MVLAAALVCAPSARGDTAAPAPISASTPEPTPELAPLATLTEDEVVRRALAVAAPTDVASARAQRELARGETAALWDNPSLAVQDEALFGPGGPSTEGQLAVSQRIDLSGRRGLLFRAAEQRGAARTKQGRVFVARFVADVRRAFYRSLFWERRHVALTGLRKRLRATRANLEARARAGDVARYDVMWIDQRITAVELQLGRATAERAAARHRLATYAGASDDVAARADALVPHAPPSDAELAAAIGAHPALAALDDERAAAKSAGAAADRWWVPTFTVTAGPLAALAPTNSAFGWVAGATVPLPVFARGQGAAAAARATGREVDARARLQRLAMERDAGALQRRATLLRDAAVAARASTGDDEALLRAASTAWSEGEAGIVQLLDTHGLITTRELATLDLELDARLASIALDALLAREVQK
jgi:outer membrane protein TolC